MPPYLTTKCVAYGADKVVLLAKPCQHQRTSRSGPIGMLERGRHPICKGTWVDRVWKYNRPAGGLKGSFVAESGFGQNPKMHCPTKSGSSAGSGQGAPRHPPANVSIGTPKAYGSQPRDDAHWGELADQAQSTLAQGGEWDKSELMDLFGE